MPFGIGLHPWWIYDSHATLQFRASQFWLEGPGYLPTDRISVPPELDFSQPKTLPSRWRNNCYSCWDGYARLCFPRAGFGICIKADPLFGHMMLYSDPDKRVLCLEPQTHATGALNRVNEENLGLVVLKQGESVNGTVSFFPFELPS